MTSVPFSPIADRSARTTVGAPPTTQPDRTQRRVDQQGHPVCDADRRQVPLQAGFRLGFPCERSDLHDLNDSRGAPPSASAGEDVEICARVSLRDVVCLNGPNIQISHLQVRSANGSTLSVVPRDRWGRVLARPDPGRSCHALSTMSIISPNAEPVGSARQEWSRHPVQNMAVIPLPVKVEISGGSLPLAGKLPGSRRHRITVAMPMLRAVVMSVRRRRSALFLRKGKVPDRKTTLPRKTGAARDPLPSHPVDDDSRNRCEPTFAPTVGSGLLKPTAPVFQVDSIRLPFIG